MARKMGFWLILSVEPTAAWLDGQASPLLAGFHVHESTPYTG
jgi:hypothetical protein